MLILHRFQTGVHECYNRTLKQSETSSPLGFHGFTATITAITWKHTALHPFGEVTFKWALHQACSHTHKCIHPIDERELTANKQHLAEGRVLFHSITNWLMAQYLVGKEERDREIQKTDILHYSQRKKLFGHHVISGSKTQSKAYIHCWKI